MSYSTSQNPEQLNYYFLLATHMVCADKQIHNKELIYLQTLEQQLHVGERTIEEKEKILAQDENLLAVETVAKGVPPNQQSEVMWQLLKLACNDGYCHPLERKLAKQVASIWSWQETEIDQRIEIEVELSSPKGILSRNVSGNSRQQIEQSRRNLLGEDYDKAITKCGVIAKEDYKFAKLALNKTSLVLEELVKEIKKSIEKIDVQINGEGQATTAKKVAKQLEDTRNNIVLEINKDIKTVYESLYAKQHALNYFTIAFMGKTKVGKSTLHATLVDEGWDAIGKGKQRTTRLNRVYEFERIRIIDTPGIGAPGGKTDKEITQSVIEESDIICYVVTNNSIQETEFSFFGLLKEKNKPLIILLNVKNNLQDPHLLEDFLNNPNQLFAMDGQSGLRGHIDRIQRYAKQNYANDYFKIFPVMLLAAQFSRQPEYQKDQDKLFKASQIQDFLDSIHLSIKEHGMIRRSQTLLGSTVGTINQPYRWVKKQVEDYQKWIDTLKNKRKTIEEQINKAKKDNGEFLQQQIRALFQETLNCVPEFAEQSWDFTEFSMKYKWEEKLQEIQFEERRNKIFQDTRNQFNTDVNEVIEEVRKELEIVSKLDGGIRFTAQDTDTSVKDFLRVVGTAAKIAGNVIICFQPFIGWGLTIIGHVSNLISTSLFKTKEQTRSEAVQNISKSLLSQLDNQKNSTLMDANKSFNQSCDDILQSINNYFNQLIAELETLVRNLITAETELFDRANALNHAYAKRIIDWCCEKEESLTDEKINKTIARVERNFGRSMMIYTTSEFQIRKSHDIIKNVLQEDISIRAI